MMKSSWEKINLKSKCQNLYKKYYYTIERKLSILIFTFMMLLTIVVLCGIMNWGDSLQDIFESVLAWLNQDAEQVFCKMREYASSWSDTIWTMVTVSASAIVFYYGALSYKNFGVQNRRIISYTVGSWFVPICVFLTVSFVVFMTYYFYIDHYTEFYLISAYIMVIQGIIIILCIYETSNAHCFRVIIKVEKRQYMKLRKMIQHLENENTNGYNYEIEAEKSSIIYHTDMAMKGEESMSKILSLIKGILLVPFSIKKLKQSPLSIDNKAIYYYIYQNARHTLNHISDENIDVGSQDFFSLLYENIDRVYGMHNVETDNAVQKNNRIKLAVYLSSLFHAILPVSQIENRWQFAGYVINAIIKEKSHKDLMIGVLLCSIAYLNYRKLLLPDINEETLTKDGSFQNSGEIKEIESCLSSIDCWPTWKCDENMLEELYDIMKVWLVGTTGEQGKYQALFLGIKNSFTGTNDNKVIAYLLYKRRGK